MYLSDHFSESEATRSATAIRLGIDNSLPPELLEQARETAAMMERIRAFLSQQAGRDVPIRVTSWYRSPALNAALKSSARSHHLQAAAVDWEAPSYGSPATICRALAPMVDTLGIGQLINEYPPDGWVHTSALRPDKAINRVITITRRGAAVGILGE